MILNTNYIKIVSKFLELIEQKVQYTKTWINLPP